MASPSRQLDRLTHLRGLAALWVLGFHLHTDLGGLAPPLLRIGRAGYLGVDLFFVLSGFVLGHAHGRGLKVPGGRGWVHFWLLRLARIYPLHLAVTLGLVALAVVSSLLAHRPVHGDAAALLRHLTLTQAWGSAPVGWNLPSWSVSAEWIAYLAFPAMIGAALAIRRAHVAVGIAGLALAGSTILLLQHGDLDVIQGPWMLARLLGPFVAGLALARARDLGLTLGRHPERIAMMLAASLVGGLAAGLPHLFVVPLFAPLVLALALASAPLGASAWQRGLSVLGERSYAIYLVQGPVMLGVLALTHGRRGPGVALAVVLASVVIAELAWRLVEGPAREVGRHVAARWLTWSSPDPQPSRPRPTALPSGLQNVLRRPSRGRR